MTRFATFGVLALSFATSALLASTVLAQDRSLGLAKLHAPASFAGEVVTHALVHDIAESAGLDFLSYDYCRQETCIEGGPAFSLALGGHDAPSALLYLEWIGPEGTSQAAILSEAPCEAGRAAGVRSIREGAPGFGIDCLAGYTVLARYAFAAS